MEGTKGTKGIKGEIGIYKCNKCGLLQNLYDYEIERNIADEYAYLDKWKCKYCEFENSYRFPRETEESYF